MSAGSSKRASKRRTILQRDQWTCVYCGHFDPSGKSLTLDHIRPKSRGGSDANNNLTTACRTCNEAKANQDWGGTHWANLGPIANAGGAHRAHAANEKTPHPVGWGV
jgi:5-methylcytosine-specific restriction endonuclease McrA